MPFHPVGNTISRGSACLAVGKHNLQLVENYVPILTPGVPMLDDPLGCKVQHPSQRIIIGKRRLTLGDLPELPVQTFNDVCRVYDFPNLRRIFKEGTQNFPIVLPTLHAGGILLLPRVSKDAQIVLSFLQRDCGVDLLQVSNQFLDILVWWSCGSGEQCNVVGGSWDTLPGSPASCHTDRQYRTDKHPKLHGF